ncbi:hypothetical protein CA982_00170 [Gordonia lacunae]|uniref:Uncharacterized protein n=1 Tax=Gordonia lacunae TaxID=417102 RepID=A0A2C9ZJB4_9ACTN|nr:hypothetical protein CA982_00170 [Gordonia lacunae]
MPGGGRWPWPGGGPGRSGGPAGRPGGIGGPGRPRRRIGGSCSFIPSNVRMGGRDGCRSVGVRSGVDPLERDSPQRS